MLRIPRSTMLTLSDIYRVGAGSDHQRGCIAGGAMTHSHSPFASPIRYAAIALTVLVLALWPLTTARADSPFDDRAFRPPQDGVGVVDGTRSTTLVPAPALP